MKSTHSIILNSLKPWQTLLFAGMLFLAQTAALLHSEVHPFHHHTETCELFQSMGHAASNEVFVPHIKQPLLEFPPYIVASVSTVSCVCYPCFWSRAPPFLKA